MYTIVITYRARTKLLIFSSYMSNPWRIDFTTFMKCGFLNTFFTLKHCNIMPHGTITLLFGLHIVVLSYVDKNSMHPQNEHSYDLPIYSIHTPLLKFRRHYNPHHQDKCPQRLHQNGHLYMPVLH